MRLYINMFEITLEEKQMEEKFGIRQNVLDEIKNYAKKHQIKKVILFGSRARGDYQKTSDIDLATIGGDHVRFALDVDEETSTLLNFDIVNLDGPVQTELRNSIESEGVLLYEEI